MTLTAIALVVTLGAVAWIVVSVVIALGLGALVSRNRLAVPDLTPAPVRVAVAAAPMHAHAA